MKYNEQTRKYEHAGLKLDERAALLSNKKPAAVYGEALWRFWYEDFADHILDRFNKVN